MKFWKKLIPTAFYEITYEDLVYDQENQTRKLLNYCKKHKIFYLFLGHHFDDNLETFILRKIAGSNLEGLNSMQFITILGNIQVVRPLLLYTKKEILYFNKKLKFILSAARNESYLSYISLIHI